MKSKLRGLSRFANTLLLCLVALVLFAPVAQATPVDMSAIGTGAMEQLGDTIPDILPVVGAIVAIALGIKLFKRFVS